MSNLISTLFFSNARWAMSDLRLHRKDGLTLIELAQEMIEQIGQGCPKDCFAWSQTGFMSAWPERK